MGEWLNEDSRSAVRFMVVRIEKSGLLYSFHAVSSQDSRVYQMITYRQVTKTKESFPPFHLPYNPPYPNRFGQTKGYSIYQSRTLKL
jgi:hypothetical protein